LVFIHAGQEIIASIRAEIGRTTEVVVDLTDLNSNVSVEAGIADKSVLREVPPRRLT
jgi:hypothetical protein